MAYVQPFDWTPDGKNILAFFNKEDRELRGIGDEANDSVQLGYVSAEDGAVRIVRMAAPYAPFTEAMQREIDVLHIIRTWQFQNDHSLATH